MKPLLLSFANTNKSNMAQHDTKRLGYQMGAR